MIILVNSCNYILCSNKWSSIKCKDYLNSLDIICTKIIKNENGTDFCDKWKANNTFDILSIPNECENKKYKLKLLVNNSKKLDLIIFLQKDNLNNFSKEEVDNLLKQKDNIEKCLDIFQKYQKKCQFTKNDIKKEKECNDFKNKEFIKFCFELKFNLDKNINNIIEKSNTNNTKEIKTNNFEKKINSKKHLNNLLEENKDIINKKVIKNNEEKKIYKDVYEQNIKSEKRYFEGENKNKDNFDDLEKGFSENKKDCVEYGLKSLEEDIIIRTKYE